VTVEHAIRAYRRLVGIRYDDLRGTVKCRALTRRINSFLDCCSDRDYHKYYAAVNDIRPTLRVKVRRRAP